MSELDRTWQARPKMSKTPGAPVSKPCGGSHQHGFYIDNFLFSDRGFYENFIYDYRLFVE